MELSRKVYFNKPGIYIIKNIETCQEYLGSTVNLYQRLHQHEYELMRGIHCNTHLQNSWNKYGKDCFEWSIEFEYNAIDEVKLRWIENLLIENFDLLKEDRGFNLTRVDEGTTYLRNDKSVREGERKPVIRYDMVTGEITEYPKMTEVTGHHGMRAIIKERRLTDKRYFWFLKDSFSIAELRKSFTSMRGKSRTNNRLVFDTHTGVYYDSVKEVSVLLDLPVTTFRYRVNSGHYNNRFLILNK